MRRVAQVLVDVTLAALGIALLAVGVIVGYSDAPAWHAIGYCMAGVVALAIAVERWEKP